MKYFPEIKDDLYHTVFAELKNIGVKVPKVKKFKSSIPKQDKVSTNPDGKIFGVSLSDQEWTSEAGFLLPKFIACCTEYLQKFIKEVGLFRKAGSVARQRELRSKLENGGNLEGSEPNDVASLLKQWLRELPESLIPSYMQDLFIRCQQLENAENRTVACLLTCLLLPPDHLHTLKHLLCFLEDIASHSEANKMGCNNLALIMAPNIFFSTTDSADKSSNLVQLHASIVQSLIENASKVGELPPSVSFRLSVQEWKSGSELDTSGDILDTSPLKSRKKLKSAHMQDIFSGIRKLVGQNGTTATGVRFTSPEKTGGPCPSAPRSASKRKADPDQQPMSPVKKQAKDKIGSEDSDLHTTPKDKGSQNLLSTNRKSTERHSRRKSFGLLKRKERKKQKSSKGSPHPKESLSVKSPVDFNFDAEIADIVFQAPTPGDTGKENFPSFNFDSKVIGKLTSEMKNSKTDLKYSHSMLEDFLDSPKSSPYSLRSERIKEIRNIPSDTKEVTSEPVGASSKCLSTTSLKSKRDVENDLKSSSSFSASRIQDLAKNDIKKRASCKENVGCRSKGSKIEDLNSKKNFADRDFRRSCRVKTLQEKNKVNPTTLSDSSIGLKSEKLKASPLANPPPTPRAKRIPRQDAFIMKKVSKDELNHSDSNIERVETPKEPKTKPYRSNLRKSLSVNLEVDNKLEVENSVKRTTRKGSIMRGRPNTVKTGLPSDLCKRFGNESIVGIADQNQTPRTVKRTPGKKSKSSVVTMEKERDGVLNESEDTSLSMKLENFNLSIPNITFNFDELKLSSEYDKPVAVNAVASPQVEDQVFEDNSFEISLRSGKRLSFQGESRSSSKGSDSKIPKLRRSLGMVASDSMEESFSDSKRKTPRTRRSDRSDSDSLSKIPVKCNDSWSDLSLMQVSVNDDSCFKTPNKVLDSPTSPSVFRTPFQIPESPTSIVWMSGTKYLSVNSPQEDVFNKRESIAMILKNKTGHVQAKVSMYDTKVRESVYCTRSVPTFSTPSANFAFNEMLPKSAKSSSKSQRSNRALSGTKSCDSGDPTTKSYTKRGTLHRSPRPPPPKFVLTPSPSVSQPLKEVTNISWDQNESRNSSLNNSHLKDEARKPKSSSIKKSKSFRKNRHSLKRNSFSGHLPPKVAKRIVRSESSPCRFKRDLVTCLIMESASDSPSLRQRDYRQLTVSKSGNCSNVGIRVQHSDQMLNEWEQEV